jgi:hypothetical protein
MSHKLTKPLLIGLIIDGGAIPDKHSRVLVTARSQRTSSSISDQARATMTSSSSLNANQQPRADILRTHTPDNWSLVPAWPKTPLGNRNLEQRRRGKQEPRGSRGESTDPNHISAKDDVALSSQLYLQIDLQDKPLPNVPSRISESGRHGTIKALSLEESDMYSGNRVSCPPVPPEMGFSFKPGDDASVLSPELAADEFVSQMNNKILGQTKLEGASCTIQSTSSSTASSTENRVIRQSETKPTALTAIMSSHIPKEFRDSQETLCRGDSTSSVVTAVRDNSVKSNRNSWLNSTQTGKPKLDRGGGNTNSKILAQAISALAKGRRNSHGGSVIASGSREDSGMEAEAQGSKDNSTSGTISAFRRQTSYPELRGKEI